MNAKHIYIGLAIFSCILIGNSYMQSRIGQAKAETTSQMANELRTQWQNDLKTALLSIKTDKETVKTPAQVAAAVPKYTPDVRPILIVPGGVPTESQNIGTSAQIPSISLPDAPSSILGGLVIPKEQIPAYWKSVTDCAEDKAKLQFCSKNTPILEQERDQWKKAAKGSFWGRTKTALKWTAIGAGIGAAAICGSGHCN